MRKLCECRSQLIYIVFFFYQIKIVRLEKSENKPLTFENVLIFNLESQHQDDEKYNKQTVIDTLYVKDLVETYSMQSDLVIM